MKESGERIKFIEKFVKPAESVNKITFQNLKLNPVSNLLNLKKNTSTDKPGPSGTLNFKQKLSKFKFMEAGPPLKPEFNLLSKKLPLQVNVKVTETLPKNMDRSANLSTNGKQEKITEQDPE